MRLISAPSIIALLALCPISIGIADDRIDELLSEIKALRAQVDRLESRVEALEDDAPAANATAMAAPAESANSEEKRGWLDNMRVELKKAEVRASGPWTEPETWDSLSVGMDEEATIELLGEPTKRKFSVRKDTDEIFIYEGDLYGEGNPVYGEVRIYKGKVRRWEAPQFPSG